MTLTGDHDPNRQSQMNDRGTLARLPQALAWLLTVIGGVLAILAYSGIGPASSSSAGRGVLIGLFGGIALASLTWARWPRSRRVVEGGTYAVMALIVAIAAVWVGFTGSPALAITAPQSGDVRSSMTLRGTAENIGNAEVWVLIRPENGDYLTTNQRPIDVIEGEWRLEASLGGDPQEDGAHYVVTALALHADEAAVLKEALRGAPGNGPASLTVDELSDDLRNAVARDDVRVTLTLPSPVEGVGELKVPADGSEVVSPFTAEGVATTPERSLWLLVRPDNNRLYTTFDMPIEVRPDGTWDLPPLRVGRGPEDIGRRFALLLVSAPATDSEIERRLNDRPPEDSAAVFSELPSDSTELDRITVELVAWR
jgi:hypothetical protein